MSPKEMHNMLRSTMKEQGWSDNYLAKCATLSASTVRAFRLSKEMPTFYTIERLLPYLGFTIDLKPIAPLWKPKQKIVKPPKVPRPRGRPPGKRPKSTYQIWKTKQTVFAKLVIVKPVNPYACLKCGRDSGVVTVAGHDQCAHCGHIVTDCCGD